MTTQDKQQFQSAGIIAIPIESNPELGLKPAPNFLVFDNQWGKMQAPFADLTTGEITQMPCVQTTYKIVSREILEPNEFHTERIFIERVLLPLENLPIPVQLLGLFFTYESIKANISIVNLALSKFTFRGALEGLVLKVDEEVLDDFLLKEIPE